jgi:hypothetical protein
MYGRDETAYKILIRKPEGKTPLGDKAVDGWLILKWVLNK